MRGFQNTEFIPAALKKSSSPVYYVPQPEKKEGESLQTVLTMRMIQHLLQGIWETSTSDLQARAVARKGGFLAGEDFVYNHLDLEDPPEKFIQKWCELNGHTGLPAFQIECKNKETGCLHICFNCIHGCRGPLSKQPPLHCEFMQGYLLGALECYSNCKNELSVYCAPFQSLEDGSLARQCRYEVLPQMPPSHFLPV